VQKKYDVLKKTMLKIHVCKDTAVVKIQIRKFDTVVRRHFRNILI